jgi:hypothetical protein
MSDSEEDVAFESADEGDRDEQDKKSSKEEVTRKDAVRTEPKEENWTAKDGSPVPKAVAESAPVDMKDRKDAQDTVEAEGDAPLPPGTDCKSPNAMEISESERSVATPKRNLESDEEAADTRGAGDVRNTLDKLTGTQSEVGKRVKELLKKACILWDLNQ